MSIGPIPKPNIITVQSQAGDNQLKTLEMNFAKITLTISQNDLANSLQGMLLFLPYHKTESALPQSGNFI